MKNLVISIFTAFVAGILGSYVYMQFIQPENSATGLEGNWASSYLTSFENKEERSEARNEARLGSENPLNALPDFISASEISTQSVVFIRNISRQQSAGSLFDWFFGQQSGGTQTQVSAGSGVIYSENGYIITNNHVIANAERIEVIHNRRTFEATLVGIDPSSDLAVLKIEAANLRNIPIGNSSQLRVGEWVLAVGNPFNLNSTVTAGIVSAKGRELNLLSSRFPIESFIQTDAAINPGNSGGALVNLKGELVGINTAILSRTGSYTGYGFAIPVDVVRKITDDLIRYGQVQKAFFGAEVRDLNEETLRNLNGINDGVMVNFIQPEGGAQRAGIQEGDIIKRINGVLVNSRAEFEEQMSFRSPGDKVSVQYVRENASRNAEVTLQNIEGTTGIVKREVYTSELLGAELETLSKMERDLFRLENGVKILKVNRGLISRLGFREENVITHINKKPINNPKELEEILSRIKGNVIVEGVNSRGERIYSTNFFR
jgi:serine protease Do